jgi:hypothetical protein
MVHQDGDGSWVIAIHFQIIARQRGTIEHTGGGIGTVGTCELSGQCTGMG